MKKLVDVTKATYNIFAVENKQEETVYVEIFTKETVYKVFSNESYLFQCAKNETLLHTMLNAYVKLLKYEEVLE